MRLTIKERKRMAAATAGRYRPARKKEQTAILNEIVELAEFAPSYAAMVLRNHGRVVNPKVRVRGDMGKKPSQPLNLSTTAASRHTTPLRSYRFRVDFFVRQRIILRVDFV